MAYFIQFPHPGAEHKPPRAGLDMGWNVGGHARKFLVSPGRYVDSNLELHDDELVFWGEWEPPSRIEQRWNRSGGLPTALHRPYWAAPATRSFRQNTDPWVFGPSMFYSNCRQTGTMQRLTAGSIVCFGSTVAGEFCIDTVFVVASSEPWVPTESARLTAGEAFIVCTAESVATAPRDSRRRFRLYRGATFDNPVHGMFSFVPARSAGSVSARFCRPAIRIPALINPASTQSPRGVRDALSIDQVRAAWVEVRRQVMGEDLLTAVWLAMPERRDGAAPIAATARPGC